MFKSKHSLAVLVLSLVIIFTAAGTSLAQIVFQNSFDNGFFVPFNASTPAGVKYGDSGWISTGSDPPVTLTEIILGLAVFDATAAGTADILFTFNDGDPSGLVFGSGAPLYSTTITGVALPETGPDEAAFFSLSIPLPNVMTAGGFNNVGFSVGVENFNYDGSFGFQASSASGQVVGFYTNNASFFDGNSWSLFSFGPDPNTGVANFVATIFVPEPSLAIAWLAICLPLLRRIRS